MTTRYKLPLAGALAPTRQLFDAISNYDRLRAPAGGQEGVTNIAFGRLYARAIDPDAGVDAELEQALLDDPGVRRDFRRLLDKTAKWYLPRVAAASTGGIRQRVGANCRIRFEPSRAESDQVYVIIELTDSEMRNPAALFVCDDAERCDKFPLPEGRDGVIQLLLARDSNMLSRLFDINTEIYLS